MRFAEPWQCWHTTLQRRLSRGDSSLRLDRRNLYILPSGFGVLWLLSAALLYVVGINSRSNGPVLISLLLLGLQGLCLFLTHANLQGLELTCLAGKASCADQPAAVLLQASSQRNRLNIAIRWLEPPQPTQVLLLKAGQTAQPLPWQPSRRGLQRPGRLLIETRAPLGLFRCWSYWEPPVLLAIAPARRAGPVRELQRPVHAGVTGCLADAEGSEAFVDLTPWRREQGLQRVAWKAVARGQGWYGKQFCDEQPLEHWLTLERSLPLETALEHLCERLCSDLAQGASLGLRLPGGLSIPPGRGDAQVQRCLQALAEIPVGGQP